MTSSLVGSEMCIRDRVKARSGGTSGASSAPCPLGATSTLASGRALARPVSYTHLTLPTICSV
eukprot:4029417-Prorocentrum_lima.AAC.1